MLFSGGTVNALSFLPPFYLQTNPSPQAPAPGSFTLWLQCLILSAPEFCPTPARGPGSMTQGSHHRLSQLSPATHSAQWHWSGRRPRPAGSQGWCGKRFHWHPLGDKRPLLCSGEPPEHAWKRHCGWGSHLQKEGRGDEARAGGSAV